MGDRPPDWDPVRPTPRVCVFCYNETELAFAWKYGAHYTCYRGICVTTTKNVVGFLGVYPNIHQAEAALYVKKVEQKEKSTRGKGRVDSRGSGARTKDHRR